MQIRLVYLGILKEIAGHPHDYREIADGCTVADLWKQLLSEHSGLARFDGALAIAVNNEYASHSHVLKGGDEVALLPPVSGGLSETSMAHDLVSEHCRITRERIDTAAVADPAKHSEDGGVCIFEGIVRNNTRGRRTLYLDYEAYEQMALKQMETLARQSRQEFKISEVRIVHRLGRLEIGETSVLVVVSAPHRGPAFEACRWLIDTLKKTVPIWKKEYFEDGAVWADGDPFPPSVPVVGR